MAICARRLGRGIFNSSRGFERCRSRQVFGRAESASSGSSGSASWKLLGTMAGGGFVGGLALAGQTALADGFEIHPPKLKWYHRKWHHTLDHESMRRGFQVYSQVCAACHTLEFLHWRDLIGATHTESEVKAMAKEHLYLDGPNDKGEMFERPGKPSDPMPAPYPNEEAARVANNGANPPELSWIVGGREGGEDYIFHILTGYYDPPTGVNMPENMHYHAYFPGNSIGMAKALYEGVMEYEDGTPATVSQMAKDVTTFLAWTVDVHQDERKRFGIKFVCLTMAMFFGMWYINRQKWAVYKTRKAFYVQLPKRR